MNTSTLQQSALQTTIPQFDKNLDGFRVAEARRQWWCFLDNFLQPLVENEMVTSNPDRKDWPMLSMLATDVTRSLRSVTSFPEIGSRITHEEVFELKFRYPKTYKIIQDAVRLSNMQKSQAEILEALQAEAEKK